MRPGLRWALDNLIGKLEFSLRASDVAVKESSELGLGQGAHAGRLHVAVLEQHERRDAADAELGWGLLILVDVDLGDLQPALVLLGDFIEDRRDRLARTAPLRPVIDQHRGVGLQYLGLERIVGYALDGVARHGSSGIVAGRALIKGSAGGVPKWQPGEMLKY